MFLPVGDDDSDRHSRPYVTYLLILINIAVFIWLQQWGSNIPFTYAYSTVPGEILSGHDIVTQSSVMVDQLTGDRYRIPGLEPTLIPVYLTLITSMFMHGGLAHLFGNMLYLWIFGDNLEDAMGRGRYIVFYLLCGVLAGLSHVLVTAMQRQNILVPSLGASGAISGVLGGYLLMFPRKKVRVWIFLGINSVPAFLAVGFWFVFQIVSSLGVIGGGETGGVAYGAHIGGFIAGFVLVKLFVRKKAIITERD